MMNFQPKLPHIDPSSAKDLLLPADKSYAPDSVESLEDSGNSFSFEKTQATLDDLLRIHEYERQRLGQELHDSTGQLVVSLLLSLARLKRVDEEDGRGILIDEIQAIVRQIDREIRSLAFLHYQAELGDRSICASIESLALGFGRRTGMHISFKCVGDASPVDDSLSTALLRVAQEALVNVHRHSHGTSAKVELKNRRGRIELRVSDDGIGILEAGELAQSGGIGLQGMRYRVEAHGGRFEVRNLNPGTMVCAVVPTAAQL